MQIEAGQKREFVGMSNFPDEIRVSDVSPASSPKGSRLYRRRHTANVRGYFIGNAARA